MNLLTHFDPMGFVTVAASPMWCKQWCFLCGYGSTGSGLRQAVMLPAFRYPPCARFWGLQAVSTAQGLGW